MLQEVIYGASEQWTDLILSAPSDPTSSFSSPAVSAWSLDSLKQPSDHQPPPSSFKLEHLPETQPSSGMVRDALYEEDEDLRHIGLSGLTGLDDLMRQDEFEAFTPSFMQDNHEPDVPAFTPPAAPAPPPPPQQTADKLLCSIVIQVQQELFQGRASRALWNLDTALHGDDDSAARTSSLQQLGENATVLRALLECVGVFAVALGPAFGQNAK